MHRILALLFLSFSCALLNAQVAGDYQTINSGNWNNLAIWQTYNGVAWVAAGVTPTAANANVITIQVGHSVVQNIAALSIDQVIVNGTMQTSTTAALGSFTVANGAGIDLQINGTFWDQFTTGVITWTGTWAFGPTGTLLKTSGSASNTWQASYNGGIATIPSTSNWILRKVVAAAPQLTTIGGFYGNLIIENNVVGIWNTTAGSTFQGAGGFPTIKGNFDVGGTGTSTVNFLNQHTNANATLVLGNVTIRAGSVLANNGTGLEIQGNLIVTGSLNYGAVNARKLIFSGANAQSISGAGALNVYDCTLNKSGNSVTLNRTMTVDNLMTFTSGLINTSNLNLLTINTNGSVTGANNTSFVNGPIRYIGGAAFTFPVGKNADYQALSYSATSIGGAFWTETFNNGCVNACTANGVNTGNGAWTVDNSNNPSTDNCGQAPQSNVWYVSCKDNGNASGTCGSGCGANATLHIGSSTVGDLGASFDAGGYCDFLGPGWGGGTNTNTMVISPTISTIGKNNITLSFNYLHYGAAGTDFAWADYSINNGATWLTLANPLPQTTCCGGPCDNAHQGLWATYSVLLPLAAENIPGFKLRFGWINDDDMIGNDPSIAINDITLATPSIACDFTCEYFYANPQIVYNNVLAPTLNSISACEYWLLSRNAGTANKTITLTWDGNSCPIIPVITDTRVAHFDLTLWQDEGNGGNTGTTAAGTVTSALPVTYFSPFTIGLIPPTPTPIEMLRFDGICTSTGVHLKWVTASELNNDYFTIERSTDGITFNAIGSVDGSGNSTTLNYYEFNDHSSTYGVNYYRIRQTDFDGHYSLSKIIVVNASDCNISGLTLNNVWLNNTDLEIDYQNGKGPVSIEVFGADGRMIECIQQLPSESKYHIETSNWSSSIYFIRITDGVSSISKTIQK